MFQFIEISVTYVQESCTILQLTYKILVFKDVCCKLLNFKVVFSILGKNFSKKA